MGRFGYDGFKLHHIDSWTSHGHAHEHSYCYCGPHYNEMVAAPATLAAQAAALARSRPPSRPSRARDRLRPRRPSPSPRGHVRPARRLQPAAEPATLAACPSLPSPPSPPRAVAPATLAAPHPAAPHRRRRPCPRPRPRRRRHPRRSRHRPGWPRLWECRPWPRTSSRGSSSGPHRRDPCRRARAHGHRVDSRVGQGLRSGYYKFFDEPAISAVLPKSCPFLQGDGLSNFETNQSRSK